MEPYKINFKHKFKPKLIGKDATMVCRRNGCGEWWDHHLHLDEDDKMIKEAPED